MTFCYIHILFCTLTVKGLLILYDFSVISLSFNHTFSQFLMSSSNISIPIPLKYIGFLSITSIFVDVG